MRVALIPSEIPFTDEHFSASKRIYEDSSRLLLVGNQEQTINDGYLSIIKEYVRKWPYFHSMANERHIFCFTIEVR